MSPNEADALEQEIRDADDELAHLLVIAYEARIWEIQGFGSWDEWRRERIGTETLVPDRDVVVEVQRRMRAAGATYQQIADATGTSRDTAWRQTRDKSDSGFTRTDSAGRARPTSYRPREPRTEEYDDGTSWTDHGDGTFTGRDGETYRRGQSIPPKAAPPNPFSGMTAPNGDMGNATCRPVVLRPHVVEIIQGIERDAVDLVNKNDLNGDEKSVLIQALQLIITQLET